jgi:hypothetical protein
LHKKIFSLIYSSNGGFTWNDVYYMPTKLREFYWNELLNAKQAERDSYESALNGANSSSPSRAKRR